MARSNRQLTQFAINVLKGYFMTEAVEEKVSAGNTEVERQICRRCPYAPPQYVVNLFGNQILRIYTHPLNRRTLIAVMISTGDFYDSKGRPSRTTRERLNGLLDALGTAKFIPAGVRVFLDDNGQCCIGKGTACKAFGSDTPAIGMLAHPNDLVFP